MKQSAFFLATLITLACVFDANAVPSSIHANTISGYNIGTIQHTITTNAFNSFLGSMGTTLNKLAPTSAQSNEDPNKTYGHAPMYGTAPLYGEFNDDGRAGRSGGDTLNADAALNNIWLNWQHATGNTNLDNISRLDTKYDTLMFGISGGQTKMLNGLSKWGLYTGYVGSSQQNHEIDIDSNGGFFGIYNGNTFGNFGLYLTLNGGVLNNSAKLNETHSSASDEYTNFWAGGAVKAIYNITLDSTFTLQPGIHVGYTWIKGENYTSATGDILKNDALNLVEVSPSIRAIKHIGNGWMGAINLTHVMTIASGGDTIANSLPTTTPEFDNYTEYSISIEKTVDTLNFSANFGRYDGAQDGWIGGLNIKYLF